MPDLPLLTEPYVLPSARGGGLMVDADPVNWERIPKPARDTLRLLRRERADAQAMWRGLNDERQREQERVRDSMQRLRTLMGGVRGSIWFSPFNEPSVPPIDENHPDVRFNEKKLEGAKAEIARLDPLIAARSHERAEIGRLVDAIEVFLRERISGLDITLHEGDETRPLRPKEKPLDRVEALRQRVRGLVADRRRVLASPWPSAMAKQRMRAAIERLAELGTPNVLALVETNNSGIQWAQVPISEHVIAGHLVTTHGDPAPLPLIAWLHREHLVRRLEEMIDSVADDEHALTQEQRTAQIAVVERDLLEAEREEEFWVQQARNSGAHLLRRPDCDPRAVLNLSGSLPPPDR